MSGVLRSMPARSCSSHRRPELAQDLLAQLQLVGSAQLCQVASEEHEVGLRIERVHVLDRLERGLGKAMAHAARVEVGVRDVRKAEGDVGILAGRRRGVGHVDQLKAVRLDDARGSGHARELERHPQEVTPVAVVQRSQQPLVRRRALGERALDLLAGHVISNHRPSLSAGLSAGEPAW
ncbi:MAG: hypothetical protein ACE5IL_16165 [Myxococcota bacterium]